MKKLFTLIAAVFISINVFAQTPQKMSYQAVIRNASNELLVSKPVKMRVSILQGSATGNAVYSELHSTTTNANGLVAIEIGGGTSQSGTFSSINWGNGTYYLKTETDPTGGTNYTITGSSQLLSVPYALQSGNGVRGISSSGDTLYLDNGKSIIIPGISQANKAKDGSGNYYSEVIIGAQIWMAENLRTTKYNDGTDIPLITGINQWGDNTNNKTQLPMMCWYDNDQTKYTANKFGALYNWYAINPSTNGNKNVCPLGWHVPNNAEWTTLSTFLGGSSVSGGKMKSVGTLYWSSPNTDATNSSGFTALPGGFRFLNGYFEGVGVNSFWWSSTEINSANAANLVLDFNNGFSNFGNSPKENGFSIRCIKD
jgi:uncharacterized protein (TIGR02145 family)